MWRRYAIAAGCAAALVLAGPVSADTIWQVPTGDWFTDAHWSAGVPGPADTALVGNGGVAQVTAGVARADTVRLGASDGGLSVGAFEGLGGGLRAGGLQVGWADVVGGAAQGSGALTGTDTDCLVAGLVQVGRARSTDDGGLSYPIVAGTGTVTLLRGEVSFGGLTVGEAYADTNVASLATGTVFVDQSLFWGAGDWRIGYADSSYGGRPTGTGTVSISAAPGSLSDLDSLTVGAGGGFRAGTTRADGSLTYRGGVLVTGDWLIGRAGAGFGGSPQATGMVDLDQVTLQASGTWVIGSAGADRASGLTAEGSARVAGGPASTADLTSVIVGEADGDKGTAVVTSAALEFTGKRFAAGAMTVGHAVGEYGTGQMQAATADIHADLIDIAMLTIGDADASTGTAIVEQADVTLRGRAVLIGGLLLGQANVTEGTAETTASLTYVGEGFAGAGDWVVGSAAGTESATVTVHSAMADIQGGAGSTADLTGVTVGQADVDQGAAEVTAAALKFAGKRFTADAMTVGQASGVKGGGTVRAATADVHADVIKVARLTIGSAGAPGLGGGGYVDRADVTLGGEAASVGSLVLGHATAAHGQADTAASLTYTGDGFAGAGDWVVGRADSEKFASATVHHALADIQGQAASTLKLGTLSVGTALGVAYSDATITRAQLDFTGLLFTADEVVAGRAEGRSSYAAADVLSARIQLDVQAAVVGTVHVGQAEAELGTAPPGGMARVQGASLDITADLFRASGAVTVGEVASNLTGGRAEASGAMSLRAGAARAASLHVGVYTGDGSGDPASFADGLLTLTDTPMAVAGNAEIGVVRAGAGSARGEIVLDASLLEVGGALTLGPGATVSVPTAGLARGTEYGAIDAMAAQLDGTLELDLLYTPQAGDFWDLVRMPAGTSFVGDFAAVVVNSLPSEFTTVVEMTSDSGGWSVYRVRVKEVPEPTALALLVLGFAPMVLRRRRRAASAS